MEYSLEVAGQGARLHALLIDAYAGSREGLRVSLEAEGCIVEATADAPRALALMRARSFDFAVLDLGLPPAPGIAQSAWDLARLFRVFNPVAPLVLLVAELGRDPDAKVACVCPALVFEKPINPAQLRAVVRQLRTEAARG